MGVVAAHLFPSLFLWAFYRWIVIRRCGHPHSKWDVARWKYLLTHSLPVGGATVFRMVAEQADVLIIQLLSDLRTVGLFSGPYRISMATRQMAQILTSIPVSDVFPAGPGRGAETARFWKLTGGASNSSS